MRRPSERQHSRGDETRHISVITSNTVMINFQAQIPQTLAQTLAQPKTATLTATQFD